MDRYDFLAMLEWAWVRSSIKRRINRLQDALDGRLAFSRPHVAVASNYAISSAKDYAIECTSGAFTVTLPTAASIPGREFLIKNSSTGVITIATTSSQTIDGALTATLTTQYESITLISNGANWIIT